MIRYQTISKAQCRALDKLSDEWQCAYELQEGLPTLHSLVRKRLAETKNVYGSIFSPRTNIHFRLKRKEPQ